jgi:hypothetical protein
MLCAGARRSKAKGIIRYLDRVLELSARGQFPQFLGRSPSVPIPPCLEFEMASRNPLSTLESDDIV